MNFVAINCIDFGPYSYVEREISMSTLARFRRAGGLLQLIKLIESSDVEKQRHLMELVAKEDPGWAHLIKVKILTVPRILSWPENILTQIFLNLPPTFSANLCQSLAPDEISKVDKCIPKQLRRDFSRTRTEYRPNPQEVWVAQIKLIQLCREMATDGRIRLSSFDPAIDLDLRLAG